jgi:transcriptional regulator with XRE-family HTH domain
MQAFSQITLFPLDRPYNAQMQPGPKPTKEQPFFGQRLAHFRQKNGLTQQQLADELDITRELVGHYERRCENPSIDFIIKLSQTLGISVDELLGIQPEQIKRGPSPRVKKLTQRLVELPKGKQGVVLEMLESYLDKAS